ncbi:DUF4172 domain-containing protein [Ramlibacter sp. 2FC]|uniref:DUF4172 domain-containing protein n=1 Tax=Ramlibacter sp. 2FC TaxID=2502188 RepID=UPI001485074C|nr:DUF4172 domain-containing protein [Ramlibacter sp. 2FC]
MKAHARPVYLWQQPGWPLLQVDAAALSGVLQQARKRQGEALALAQDLGTPTRLYSLSDQLLASRSDYYEALNQAQKGTPDVTAWVRWFADALAQAGVRTTRIMLSALQKQRFWAAHAATPLNERQRKVVKKLLDAGDGGFLGGLSAEKYVKITGASKATATRDLAALLQHGLLRVQGSGKASRYQVNVQEWGHAGAD